MYLSLSVIPIQFTDGIFEHILCLNLLISKCFSLYKYIYICDSLLLQCSGLQSWEHLSLEQRIASYRHKAEESCQYSNKRSQPRNMQTSLINFLESRKDFWKIRKVHFLPSFCHCMSLKDGCKPYIFSSLALPPKPQKVVNNLLSEAEASGKAQIIIATHMTKNSRICGTVIAFAVDTKKKKQICEVACIKCHNK